MGGLFHSFRLFFCKLDARLKFHRAYHPTQVDREFTLDLLSRFVVFGEFFFCFVFLVYVVLQSLIDCILLASSRLLFFALLLLLSTFGATHNLICGYVKALDLAWQLKLRIVKRMHLTNIGASVYISHTRLFRCALPLGRCMLLGLRDESLVAEHLCLDDVSTGKYFFLLTVGALSADEGSARGSVNILGLAIFLVDCRVLEHASRFE